MQIYERSYSNHEQNSNEYTRFNVVFFAIFILVIIADLNLRKTMRLTGIEPNSIYSVACLERDSNGYSNWNKQTSRQHTIFYVIPEVNILPPSLIDERELLRVTRKFFLSMADFNIYSAAAQYNIFNPVKWVSEKCCFVALLDIYSGSIQFTACASFPQIPILNKLKIFIEEDLVVDDQFFSFQGKGNVFKTQMYFNNIVTLFA